MRTIQYRMSTWAGSRESHEYRYAMIGSLFYSFIRPGDSGAPCLPTISHVHTIQEHLLQIYERHIKISRDRPHIYAIPKSRTMSTNLGVRQQRNLFSRNFLVYFWGTNKITAIYGS